MLFSTFDSYDSCVLQKYGVNLIHIESRPSARFPNRYEFMIECAPSGELGIAIENLREHSSYFNIISRNHKDNIGKHSKYNRIALETRPWTHQLAILSPFVLHYLNSKASSRFTTNKFLSCFGSCCVSSCQNVLFSLLMEHHSHSVYSFLITYGSKN